MLCVLIIVKDGGGNKYLIHDMNPFHLHDVALITRCPHLNLRPRDCHTSLKVMAPSSHCGSPIVLRDTCGLHAVTAPRPSRGGDRTKRRLAHDPWISFNLQPTRITRLVNRLNCYRGTKLQSARTCHGCMGLLSHRTSKPTRATLPMQRQVRSGGPCLHTWHMHSRRHCWVLPCHTNTGMEA